MRSYLALCLAALAGIAACQNSTANTTAGTYTIDPDTVPIATRDIWCNSQQAACPLICLQTAGNTDNTIANACDPETLTYSCVCSNGLSPNASQYSQTLPYFICTQWGNDCVTNCGGDSMCAYNCRANHPCGAQDPTRVNITTTSSMMTATSTKTGSGESTNSAGQTIYSGLGGSPTSTSSSSGGSSSGGHRAASVLEGGQTFGLALVAASIFGGFAFFL